MVDAILLGVLAVSMVLGVFRGLVREVVSLLSWLAAALVAWLFAEPLAAAALPWLGDGQLPVLVAAIALFLAVLLAGSAITALLRGLLSAIGLGFLDRLLGVAFGALRGVLVLLVIVTLLEPVAASAGWWRDSELVPLLLQVRDELLHAGPLAGRAALDIRNGGTHACAA